MTAVATNALEDFMIRYGPAAGERGPEMLVREVFGADPDEWQIAVLRAFGRGERGISLESCHGPGKTCVLAWLIWVHMLTRFPQKTACTAPTGGQLNDALLAEVKTWGRKLPPALFDLYDMKSDRIVLLAAPEESFATFRTARPENPEALQGIHSVWVLLIADEASGVPGVIFESAIGSMSGHNACTILAGNPVRTGGFFYNSHHGDSADDWFKVHVSGIDGPHMGEYSYVSPRVSPEFCEMVAREYGTESNAYRVRVLGIPPKSEDDSVIPFEWIEAARGRDVKVNPAAPTIWGLDVGTTDLLALAKRKANVLLEPIKTWQDTKDVMLCVGIVKAEWDNTYIADRPAEICVDAIGLGAGVADRLRELGLPVRAVNVSENPALNAGRYRNLRTELWFEARDWYAKRDCTMPEDARFEQELSAQKYKAIESSGKVICLPKREMMKHLHPRRSPDRADAFILTFASNAATAIMGSQGLSWNQPVRRNIKGLV
jgi:hypothetical protein